MAPDLLTPPVEHSAPESQSEPMRDPAPPTTETDTKPQPSAVRSIIDRDRRDHETHPTALRMTFLGAVLLFAAFPPLDWSPLGWWALLPWLLLVRLPNAPRRLYLGAFAASTLCHAALFQWMRLGDPLMYGAWFAMSVYIGLYLPVFLATTRVAVHRMAVPLWIAAPLTWCGLEYLQSHLLTGFSWYFLGHTQYGWTTLIQIADVVGAYGISFLMVLVTASLAGILPARWVHKTRLLRGSHTLPEPSTRSALVACSAAVFLFGAVFAYGSARLSQPMNPEGETPLRVAMLQGNFTSSARTANDPREVAHTYWRLTGEATRHQPDVIVWPEAASPNRLFVASEATTEDELKAIAPNVPYSTWTEQPAAQQLADFAKQANAAMVVGIDTMEADRLSYEVFNSAVFVRPQDEAAAARYDKIHRVPFGEYIPLANWIPGLRIFTPFSSNFGVAAGDHISLFEWNDWTLSPIICYEDTDPGLVRQAMRVGTQKERPVDLLVNLTNDGWFHPKSDFDERLGSTSSEQHLITSAFRAVETRTPLVRSVNTGISAYIDGNGRIREPHLIVDTDARKTVSMIDDETGSWRERFTGVVIADVVKDTRSSLYVRFGDWFAQLCTVFLIVCVTLPVWWRLQSRRTQPQKATAKA